MTHHERDELYGGSVILVGVAEARGIRLPANSKLIAPNAYCTIVPLDQGGNEIRSEAQATRCIAGSTPAWDEVHAICTRTDLSQVSGFRVKLKHHESRWKLSERLGDIDIRLSDIELLADANFGRFHDAWYTTTFVDGVRAKALKGMAAPRAESARDPDSVAPLPSSPGTGAGLPAIVACAQPDVHIYLTLHRPPPDPQPVAVHVRVVQAKALTARGERGVAEAYLQVKPLQRADLRTTDDDGHKAVLATRQLESADPLWNESLLLYDPKLLAAAPFSASSSTSPPGAAGAGAAAIAAEPALESLGISRPFDPYARHQALAVDLASTHFLAFSVKDKDKLSVGGDKHMGVATVSFADLWGDEDAVITERTLRVQKWYRLRTSQRMDRSLNGTLGHVRLDITLCFAQQLLPPGWVESTDTESDHTYFYCIATGASQWDEPAELVALRDSGVSGGTGAAAGGGDESDSSSIASASTVRSSPLALASLPRAVSTRFRHGSFDVHTALVMAAAGSRGVSLTSFDDAAEGADSSRRDSTSFDSSGHRDSESSPTPDPRGLGAPPLTVGRTLTAVPESDVEESAATPQRLPEAHSGVASASGAAAGNGVFAVADRGGKPSRADDDGDGDAADRNDEDEEEEYDAAKVAEKLKSMDPFGSGKKASAAVPSAFSNPLAGMDPSKLAAGRTQADRMRLMAEAMSKERADKVRAEEEALAAKLRAMTPEERTEYEAGKQRDTRREQRKNRMLQSQMTSYGVGTAKKFTGLRRATGKF